MGTSDERIGEHTALPSLPVESRMQASSSTLPDRPGTRQGVGSLRRLGTCSMAPPGPRGTSEAAP